MRKAYTTVVLSIGMIVSASAQIPTFTKVADTSTPIPNGSGNFATFSNMITVDALGNVAFSEDNGNINNGIYLYSSGTLTRVADTNTPIPGGTGNFASFSFFGNGMEAGTLAFRGSNAANEGGIYAYRSDQLVKIADTQTPIPDGTGSFMSFTTAYVDGSEYAFIANGESDQQGIYVSDGTAIRRIADNRSVVPEVVGSYSWSAQLGFDQGNLAFWSYITGDSQPETIIGGYTSDGGLVTLATYDTVAPGTGSNFTNFSSPADLSGRTLVFQAQYGSTGQGIFSTTLDSGPITLVADNTTAVPEGNGNFSYLISPCISGGRIAFIGFFDGGMGIYLKESATLRKIIDNGDTLDGKTITSFGMSENSLDGDYLAFRVNFSDSTYGIYRTSFSPATVVRKPDALIRVGSGTPIGDNIYNKTGAGQSRRKSARPGKSITFTLTIQNDGSEADSFKVRAAGSSVPGYKVTYTRGRTKITPNITAGTYTTASLAPGASTTIKAKVLIKPDAAVPSKLKRLVTVTSNGSATKKDAVRFQVNRAR